MEKKGGREGPLLPLLQKPYDAHRTRCGASEKPTWNERKKRKIKETCTAITAHSTAAVQRIRFQRGNRHTRNVKTTHEV